MDNENKMFSILSLSERCMAKILHYLATQSQMYLVVSANANWGLIFTFSRIEQHFRRISL